MKYLYLIYAIVCSISLSAQSKQIFDQNIEKITFQRRSQSYTPDSSFYFLNPDSKKYELRLLKNEIGFRPSRIIIIGTDLRGEIKGKGITPADNVENTSIQLFATLPAERFIQAEIIYDQEKRYILPTIEIISPIVPSPFRDTMSFIWLFSLAFGLFGLLLFTSFRKYSFFNRKNDVLELVQQEQLNSIVFQFSIFTLLGALASGFLLSRLLNDRIYHVFSFAIMGIMIANLVLIALFVYTSFKLRSISDHLSSLHANTWLFTLLSLIVVLCPYLIQEFYAYLPISVSGFTSEVIFYILIIWRGSHHLRKIRTAIQPFQSANYQAMGLFTQTPTPSQPTSTNLNVTILEINRYVAKNDILQAFKICERLLQQHQFSRQADLQSELVLLESRYHRWVEESRQAGSNPDYMEITRNTINKDFLAFIKGLGEE